MRYMIRFSYNGSKFQGFQRLKKDVTVQKTIEEALSSINKAAVEIKGAGRTDVGVHALGQCAHFDMNVDIPIERLKTALDHRLGSYIHIIDCQIVDANFHARFSVKEKIYVYRIYFGDENPFYEDFTYICPFKVNLSKMKKVGKLFLGVHNFQNFVSGKRDHYDAILYQISFKRQKQFLTITFRGKSFYRYMVRNLVGAMLDVGKGKRTISEVQEAIKNPTKEMTFTTAKSSGLYLKEVKY